VLFPTLTLKFTSKVTESPFPEIRLVYNVEVAQPAVDETGNESVKCV